MHEAIEPKVVHRDIKSSNILIDNEFNAKVSDFGLAKLLDSGESHITTRVMGTFGYICALLYFFHLGLLIYSSNAVFTHIALLIQLCGSRICKYRLIERKK